VEQCGGNGLYVHGDDTNAGCAIALSCIDNLGWGIVDESPLNNTYVACHVASVSTLAYRALSVIPADEVHPAPYQRGAGCLFVGCYAEDDTLSEIDEPNAVFGGQVHGIQGSAVWLRQGPRALFPNGVAAGNQVPSPSGKNVGGVLGGTSTADTALELWDDLNGGEVYRLVFSSKENPNTISDPAGYLELKYDNVSGTILCFGTSKADLGPNSLWMPGGYYLGVPELAQRVRVTMGSARPTSGPAQRGDRVLNAAPVPGDPENGYAGWICVESSSPANPAGMWKGFGAIEV